MATDLIDQIGSWSYSVVIAVSVFDRTHSTAWLAGLAASRWSVGLILSGYAGMMADRFERTAVMAVSASLSSAVMAVMAVAVGLQTPVWSLLVLTAAAAAVGAPYRAAAVAVTRHTVAEADLAAANAVVAAVDNLVVVVGPAIGGALLIVASPTVGVGLNAATFVVAAVAATRLGVRSRGEVEATDGLVEQWLVGLRVIVRDRNVAALVGYCALASSVYGASTVIYAPLAVHLGGNVNGYSYLLVGSALGGVIAAGVANRLSARIHLAPVIVACVALQAVPFAVTAVVDSPAIAFGLQVVSGIGMVVVDVLALTSLQRSLADATLSRAVAAFDAVTTAAVLAASFVAAALLAHAGLTATLIALGLGVPALGVLALPLLRQVDRERLEVVEQRRDRVAALTRANLFEGAPQAVLERLAEVAEPLTLPARTILIRQGDPSDTLWILVRGSLAVRVTGDEAPARQLPTVSAPSYVGEVGLVRGVARTATVRTREECDLLRIDGSIFLDAVATAPPSGSLIQLTGTRWARTVRAGRAPTELTTAPLGFPPGAERPGGASMMTS